MLFAILEDFEFKNLLENLIVSLIFFGYDYVYNTPLKPIIDWLDDYNKISGLGFCSVICTLLRAMMYTQLGGLIPKEDYIFKLFALLLTTDTYTLGVIRTLFLGFLSGFLLLLFLYIILKT